MPGAGDARGASDRPGHEEPPAAARGGGGEAGCGQEGGGQEAEGQFSEPPAAGSGATGGGYVGRRSRVQTGSAPRPASPRPRGGTGARRPQHLNWRPSPPPACRPAGGRAPGPGTGEGLRGVPAERAAPAVRQHTRAQCAQDSRARAVRAGARLRVTQHPRVARVSESVTRPAADLPGGWQLRVCALPPIHPSECDHGLPARPVPTPHVSQRRRAPQRAGSS